MQCSMQNTTYMFSPSTGVLQCQKELARGGEARGNSLKRISRQVAEQPALQELVCCLEEESLEESAAMLNANVMLKVKIAVIRLAEGNIYFKP